jgi:hypothetical protein
MKIPRKVVEVIWLALENALKPDMAFSKDRDIIEDAKTYIESILVKKVKNGRKPTKRKNSVRRRSK